MNQAEIKGYTSRLLDRAFRDGLLTLDERIDTEVISSAESEIEWQVEGCEEIGSSDQYYHYQGMLHAINKPSIYSPKN